MPTKTSDLARNGQITLQSGSGDLQAHLCHLLFQMGIFYLMSKRVLRSIPYGQKPRNRLDMYIPRNHWKNPDVCIPVVIYVTGARLTKDVQMTPF